MVIADRLAVYVNQVYGNIQNANSLSVLIAVCFFSIQIYCDFSGYSDIARGTAKMMGYDLIINFDRPYMAQSISEFWARWHISLSTWFRDYLYIPLGGNRAGKLKWYRNLLIVFLVSGLWHGANWTFIVWGALHGIYLLLAILTSEKRRSIAKKVGLSRFPAVHKFLNRIWVFIIVTFAWIFFRAESFDKARAVIHKLGQLDFSFNLTQLSAGKGPLNLALSFFCILLLGAGYFLPKNLVLKRSLSFTVIITFLIIILGKNVGAEFIYFQF